MSSEKRHDNELSKSKIRRKSKGPAQAVDETVGDDLDAMLDSASKVANRVTSSRQKPIQKPVVESAGRWSNDANNEDDNEDVPIGAPFIRPANRRPTEEIIAADIPTIPMDDADGDDAIDMPPEIAAAPDFSFHQIATFKEIEKEFSRTRASQFIDPKINIGILYQNLNLQEEIDAEDQKIWDWDKLFVEVRNAIANPIIQ